MNTAGLIVKACFVKGGKMGKVLNKYEQETTINFNEAGNIANIFTYNKTWQRHLESRLGLKPLYINSYGGREYELPKNRIKPPRAPKKLSASTKKKLIENLRRTHIFSPKT